MKNRFALIASLMLMTAACSSAPRTGPELESGQALSEAVAKDARQAEKDGETGVIYASSEDQPAVESTTEKPEPPVAPKSVPFAIHVDAQGVLKVDGEPKDLEQIKALLGTRKPASVEVVSVPETDNAKVVELLDAIKAAGINRVVVTAEKPPTATTDAPPAEDKETPQ